MGRNGVWLEVVCIGLALVVFVDAAGRYFQWW